MYRAVVAALFTLAFSGVEAQEIPKPTHVVGEWCEYDVDAIPRSKQRTEVITVAADGGYTIKVTGGATEQLRVYNSDHQMIQWDERSYTPASKSTPIFPIKVGGREGGGSFTFPHQRRQGVTVNTTTEIKPIVPERVTVPAGTFDTLRADTVSNYRLSSGFANQFTRTIWYSLDPTISFPVKMESIDYGWSSPYGNNSHVVRSLIKCGSAAK